MKVIVFFVILATFGAKAQTFDQCAHDVVAKIEKFRTDAVGKKVTLNNSEKLVILDKARVIWDGSQKIITAFRGNDKQKLGEYIKFPLISGPLEVEFKGFSLEQLFGKNLEVNQNASPVCWRFTDMGVMFGASIWAEIYPDEQGNDVLKINSLPSTESNITIPGQNGFLVKYNNSLIRYSCFTHMWASADNYEEFAIHNGLDDTWESVTKIYENKSQYLSRANAVPFCPSWEETCDSENDMLSMIWPLHSCTSADLTNIDNRVMDPNVPHLSAGDYEVDRVFSNELCQREVLTKNFNIEHCFSVNLFPHRNFNIALYGVSDDNYLIPIYEFGAPNAYRNFLLENESHIKDISGLINLKGGN